MSRMNSVLSWSSSSLIGSLMVVCSVLSVPFVVEGAPPFEATVIDAEGVEGQIQNFRFYYEERLDETAFVPHELHHVPVKKGAATIQVKFSSIKEIHVQPNGKEPELTVHLTNGKTGKFPLGIDGRFRGDSDFGEVDFLPSGIRSIIFAK
ncbi:MAG: hypothetical protein NPIRA01_02700 [Nitrospirales bacterium]|nr:MAG: hypothetical protein NPIRA01_02700 [Nitrospirales bacterium]